MRCVMRTRHGTPAPTRTHCQHCGGPLSRRQQWRRREFCSKGCAKAAYWQRHPDKVADALAGGWARMRRAFVARLRAFLATATKPDAGRRGWRNGWECARGRAVRAGYARPPVRKERAHVARCAALAAAAPTAAEAYRRCYAEAYHACWRRMAAGGRAAAA
jgi:hypothetical protein